MNITKDRQKILDALLNPPDGRWMIQVVSDFLNKLNGWIVGQKLNISTDGYKIIYDKKLVMIENTQVREFTDFARKLRKKDVPKRIMNGNFSSSDLDYYDIDFEELKKIKELKDKEVWNLVTRLVE